MQRAVLLIPCTLIQTFQKLRVENLVPEKSIGAFQLNAIRIGFFLQKSHKMCFVLEDRN